MYPHRKSIHCEPAKTAVLRVLDTVQSLSARVASLSQHWLQWKENFRKSLDMSLLASYPHERNVPYAAAP
jgi:hypothetical protein